MADIENEVINEEGTCENETEESSSIPWLGTSEYTHFVPHEKPRPDFEEIFGLKHHLIKSLDELKDFYEHVFKPNSVLAWDTETTSLNPEQGAKTGDYIEGVICGFSFTQDGKNGYYVPVQHPDYALGYKALKIFYAMIRKSALNLLYNARFDMRFMEFMTPEKYGYIPEEDERIYEFDLSKIKYFDVQGSVWLSDTNVIMPSLKRAEVHFLGWMPPHFEDNFDADTSDEGTEKSKRKKKNIEQNFGFLPAERGYRYASIDALATYQLYLRTKQYYEESRASGKLDNEALYPLMKLENYPIYIDHDYLLSMRGDVLKHIEELKNYLFEKAGREFKINSGRELAKVFMDLGIDLGGRTKLGIMKTDIKSINNYMATHPKNEYLTKLIEYKQLVKFDNSYLETLINISDPEEVKKHPIRFSYNTCRVPTGRLACGGDKKNKFFSPLNYQSLPKPHSHMYHCHKATPEQIANKEDLAGWIFNDDPEGSYGLVEGQDPHLNVRKAFRDPNNDGVIISVDMCAEAGSPVQSKRGYLGLSELRVGDEILTPNGYKTVIRVMNTGCKKICKINTNGQALYCSEDHPIILEGKQVKASQISKKLQMESFKAYDKTYKDKLEIVNKLSPTKVLSSLKEKRDYIINNDLISILKHNLSIYSRKSICALCGVNLESSSAFLNGLGIEPSKNKLRKDFNRSYNNIFEGVSNPTSAYLLGYIYGDGNITRRRHGYLTLNISSKDKEHLIRITEIFGGGIKLTSHIKNGHLWWSFGIYDSAICNRLFELGVRERKSYVGCELPLDWLGENFRHFIRGLFDSDGYVRIKSKYLDFSFVGHDSYIKKIFELNPEHWSYKQKPSLSLLSLKGDFESKKFIYEYLYKDATIWLQRKRDIIDQWYENIFGDLFMNTWDITIDSEDHLYYLNGILSHNCAEEVRVVTNVYHEDNWIDAFNSGEDLHKRTACLIFGEENYCKEARKKAKCISGDSKLYTDQGIINIRDICSTRELGTPIDVNFKLATPEGFCKCSKFIYNGIKETLRFSMSNGDILEVTPDHLVRSNNKWIQAKEFKVGDFIDFESTIPDVSEDSSVRKILSIENSMSDVYDLTIENETHSFLANGFVVHNCASFGMLYGSTTKGFNRQFPDMTYEECEDFMNKFRAAVPNIIAGQKEAIRKAKRLGTTYTFFGRPRRLRYYYSSPDRSVQAFGDRTVGNTAIQGAAADILKIMLKRVYDKIFSKYPEVSFIGTIHDEINYLVPRNLISTIVPLILECQTIDLRSKGWPVVLECDLSMGLTFGSLIPFYFKDGEFTPQLEEIKKDEPVTVEASSKDDTSEFADDNFNYLE